MQALAHRAKVVPFPKQASSNEEELRYLIVRRTSLIREREGYEQEFASNAWPRQEFEGFYKSCLNDLKAVEIAIAKLKS